MDDDLAGLTASERKLVRLVEARSKTIVVEAFGQLRKDLDEVTKNIDRRLSPVEEALK
jgi:hypothetical protein